MKKAIKAFTVAIAAILLPVLTLTCFSAGYFPDEYRFTGDANERTVQFSAISVVNKYEANKSVNSGAQSTLKSEASTLMLGGIIPIKEVTLNYDKDIKVIPCGTPFGIKLFTHGVMIVKTDDVYTDGKSYNPAKNAGLKTGDIITKINGNNVNSNEELIKYISESGGNEILLRIMRDEKYYDKKIMPVKTSENGDYKIGIWVRDSSAGIGTMTFYEPESKSFAGLGHGICDVDTGTILPLNQGDIVDVKLDSITKGKKGTAGSLNGHFESYEPIGELYKNSESGVYGYMEASPTENEAVSVACAQEVKTGSAQLLTTVNGDTPKYYDIEIESINYDSENKTQNMTIKITDDQLLTETGGIVQGMSGSPILQNGKLVGAVTHVFVNNPDKGYAIFAENMLSNCDEKADVLSKDAA
ncbi:MAG: SpoIVB peptidase [Acutalibacteraceae bacterium]